MMTGMPSSENAALNICNTGCTFIPPKFNLLRFRNKIFEVTVVCYREIEIECFNFAQSELLLSWGRKCDNRDGGSEVAQANRDYPCGERHAPEKRTRRHVAANSLLTCYKTLVLILKLMIVSTKGAWCKIRVWYSGRSDPVTNSA